MKRMIFAIVLATLPAWSASAQTGSYLECTACQLVLGLVDASAGDGQDLVVDASKQCSLLPAQDRAACERFYADMGPKFIKAFKARRAKGEGFDSICRAMAYCQ